MFDRDDIRDEEDLRDAAAQELPFETSGQKQDLRGQKHRNLPWKDIRMIECPRRDHLESQALR